MNASLLHAFKLCTVHTEFLAFGKVKFSQESQVQKVFAQFSLIFKPITTPLQLTNVVKYEPKMGRYFSSDQIDFLLASYFSVVMPLVLSSLIPRRHNRLALSASPA